MNGIVTINANCFIARYPVRDDKREEFMTLFDSLWHQGLDFMNEHCHLVFYGWDRSDKWFYTIESYKNEEAVAQLRQTDMFKQMVSQLLAYCDGNMELQNLRGAECDRSVFDKYPAGRSAIHPEGGGNHVVMS